MARIVYAPRPSANFETEWVLWKRVDEQPWEMSNSIEVGLGDDHVLIQAPEDSAMILVEMPAEEDFPFDPPWPVPPSTPRVPPRPPSDLPAPCTATDGGISTEDVGVLEQSVYYVPRGTCCRLNRRGSTQGDCNCVLYLLDHDRMVHAAEPSKQAPRGKALGLLGFMGLLPVEEAPSSRPKIHVAGGG